MKKNFYNRLNKLSDEAKVFIEQLMEKEKPKRVMRLFIPSKDDCSENKDGEYIGDMPSFQVYDKHGFVTYANLTKLKVTKDGVLVCGSEKEGYGDISAYLHELDPQDLIWMAEYLDKVTTPL